MIFFYKIRKSLCNFTKLTIVSHNKEITSRWQPYQSIRAFNIHLFCTKKWQIVAARSVRKCAAVIFALRQVILHCSDMSFASWFCPSDSLGDEYNFAKAKSFNLEVLRWQEPSELCFKKADSRQLCVKMLVHTAVWTALYALIWQKSALFKIFDLKDEDIGGDFCSSLLQVGWRPPKEKGRKAPQFTALRQVRIILVTLRWQESNQYACQGIMFSLDLVSSFVIR